MFADGRSLYTDHIKETARLIFKKTPQNHENF